MENKWLGENALQNAKKRIEEFKVDDIVGKIWDWELDVMDKDNPKGDVKEGLPDKEMQYKIIEVVVSTFKAHELKDITSEFCPPVGRNMGTDVVRIQYYEYVSNSTRCYVNVTGFFVSA